MKEETILIIGGSGSLGNKLIDRFLENNKIIVYSRDESKHWKMSMERSSNNLDFVIGDIRDSLKVTQTILRIQPTIIIMAAALKHIDRCEYETNECIGTNLIGTQNVLNAVELNKNCLRVRAVCFVSTDKACSPVNVYGMMKAASECLMVEKAKHVPGIKFVTVRYGNVLNSRGSILPKFHKIGKNNIYTHYNLTDKRMTRFVMTLDQSVDLIEHAIQKAESGDIVIPKLVSCNIKDLMEIFSEKYGKPIKETELRPGEKMMESLINETQSMRLVFEKNENEGYIYIKPSYSKITTKENCQIKDYNSKMNPFSKDELKNYLENLNLL